MFVWKKQCFGSARGPVDVALSTYLVFPGALVQWSTSHGVLGTDSLFHQRMEQVPSESGRRKKHKEIKFIFTTKQL